MVTLPTSYERGLEHEGEHYKSEYFIAPQSAAYLEHMHGQGWLFVGITTLETKQRFLYIYYFRALD